MRPDTAPAGSRITASVTESQTSSVPRWIGTRRPRLAARDREAAVEDVLDRAAERVRAGDAGDPLGGRVPEDDVRVPVDGDDAVGDVREDRVAALAVDRDRREELRVRERGRRVRRERLERLDLVLPPRARAPRVDRQHAVHRSLRADERDAEVRAVARGDHRIGFGVPRVFGGVRRAPPSVCDW